MATLDDARAGVTRHIERHLLRDIEYGFLAIVQDGAYVFDITNSDGDLIKPGYVQCRIEAGLSFEPGECIPRVALDPYTRCKFRRVAGVLEAVEFVAQDAVRNYKDQAPALGVPSHPLPNRGGVELDAGEVAYTPATPADYDTTQDDADGALDELASRVRTVEGGGGGGGSSASLLLDYAANTDLFSGTSISATTWTDVNSNQSFTVTDGSALVEFAVMCNMIIGAGLSMSIALRLVIDSAGTPINKPLEGGRAPAADYGAAPGGVVKVSGLSAAAHTVKIQVQTTSAATANLRANTVPDFENLAIQVTQL